MVGAVRGGWVGAAEHKAVRSRAVCVSLHAVSVSQPWASSPLWEVHV